MINQLVNNIKKLDAPIVVGLDPMLDYVPEYIKKAAFAEYGESNRHWELALAKRRLQM